jgi:ketosteroid isomerase-like protein
MSTADRTAFLESILPTQISAEVAVHNGDVTPRLSTWSHEDPVTLFGAGRSSRGWDATRQVFDWVAASFTACHDYDFELVASDADAALAYTVGVERYRATTAAGEDVQHTLRVTHVYRREPSGWRIVHRHADHEPPER